MHHVHVQHEPSNHAIAQNSGERNMERHHAIFELLNQIGMAVFKGRLYSVPDDHPRSHYPKAKHMQLDRLFVENELEWLPVVHRELDGIERNVSAGEARHTEAKTEEERQSAKGDASPHVGYLVMNGIYRQALPG